MYRKLLSIHILVALVICNNNYLSGINKMLTLTNTKTYANQNSRILEIDCHYTCLQCSGSTQYDCLTCNINNGRIKKNNQCVCNKFLIEIDGEEKCQSFNQLLPNSQFMNSQQELTEQICQYGYFKIFQNSSEYVCKQCPLSNIECIDCYLNSETWYLNPICTQEYTSFENDVPGGNFGQVLNQKDPQNYQLFFITQGAFIIFCPYYLHICNLEEILDYPQTCKKVMKQHLNQETYVICKNNTFYQNNDCYPCQNNCLSCENYETCILCPEQYYLKDGECIKCPEQCSECIFKQNIVQCTSCNDFYLITDGKCEQCGANCRTCMHDNDRIIGNFIRCLRCEDSNKFYLSANAKDCIANFIENCLYSLQSYDFTYFFTVSLDYRFKQFYTSAFPNIYDVCARCVEGYALNWDGKCIEQIDQPDCLFFYQSQFGDIDSFCLIGDSFDAQQNNYCTASISNCQICVKENFVHKIVCIQCITGYYAHRISGICFECPEQLKCLTCYQQQIIEQDNWTTQTRAVYEGVINGFLIVDDVTYYHNFRYKGQSPNIEDYEVVCETCQDGYALYNNKCIEACPKECLQCTVIDDKNQCIKCGYDYQGRILNIVNNKCESCPSNCQLCKERTKLEIYQINPFFNDPLYSSFSNICIQESSSQEQLQYDHDLGQFQFCSNQNQVCQNTLILNQELYCDSNIYDEKLNSLSEDEQILFKQKSIKLQDLLVNGFEYLQNDWFYEIANKIQLNILIFKIQSPFQQICLLENENILALPFRQHIFSLKKLEIDIQGFNQTKFMISDSTTFQNFSTITFDSITIMFGNSKLIPQTKLFFKSLQKQEIYFNNVQILSNSINKLTCQIEIINFQIAQLNNIAILNTNFITLSGLFSFAQSTSTDQGIINIYNLTVLNVQSISSTFLYIVGGNYILNLEKISIYSSNFYQTNIFKCADEQECGQFVSLNNVEIVNTNISSSSFYNFEKVSSLSVSNFLLSNSTLKNSIILYLSKNSLVNQVEINNISLFQSQLMVNSLSTNTDNFNYFFTNITIANIQYDSSSKIVELYKFISYFSEIHFLNLQIVEIAAYGAMQNNLKKIAISLFVLEAELITLFQFSIEKGAGLPYFSLFNSQQIEIQSAKFFSQSSLKILQQILNEEITSFGSIFLIYSSLNLLFENVTIIGVIGVNYPLMAYQSSPENEEEEVIQITDCLFKDNILFQSESIASQSIFDIKSWKNISIIFNNTNFKNNILYSTITGNDVQVGTLVTFDQKDSSITFFQCLFESNIALNTEHSIFQIKAQSIYFVSSNFFGNGVMNEQIISFIESLKLISDQQAFQFSGNGLFISNVIKIINCTMSTQKGIKGAIINYQPLLYGSIELSNTTCDNSENYFLLSNEVGGGIFVNSASVDVKILIKNSIFRNGSSNEGGILLIQQIQGAIDIQFENVVVENVISLKGSLISVNFSSQYYQTSQLMLNNVTVKNDESSFSYFCELLSMDQSQNQNLWQIILNERILISTFLGNIYILNCIFSQLFNEMVLQDLSVNQFFGSNITIQNSYLSKGGMINLIPIQKRQMRIYLEFIIFKNLSIIDWWQVNQNITSSFSKILASNGSSFQLTSFDQDQKIESIISILSCNSLVTLNLKNMQFELINCSSCQAGLIYFQFDELNERNLQVENLQIKKNSCGISSCFLILKNLVENMNFDIYEKDQNQKEQNTQAALFYLENYICTENMASYGTCFLVENFKGTINNSYFWNNKAEKSGGAIFYFGDSNNLLFQNTYVFGNSAYEGGGVVYHQSFSTFNNSQIFINFNSAQYQGDQELQIPSYFKIKLNQQFYLMQTQQNNTDLKIVEISQSFNSTYNRFNKYEYLPSGQKISSYQLFNFSQNQYESLELIFRLVPFDQVGTQIKNLDESKCTIQGRLYDLLNLNSSEEKIFTQNFTNLNVIYYDSVSEDYNLDDLMIYFDPDLPQNYVLQLQFQCNAIKYPMYDSNNSQFLIGYTDEYYLRLNIRSLPCQLGELKLESDNSCHPCDYKQDQYSVTLNATQCKIRDNQMMDEVRSAQIKLRTGYWRPYINSEIVENCYNQESNCLGGWNPGDKSCAIGHIGALCEQCDIHNIRGDGSFSISKKFSCGSCNDTKQNTLIIIGISIWTLISILISVKSTVEIVKQLARATKLKSIGISIVINKNNAVNLIKILTNYLQIIASVTTFQLNLPKNMDYFINSLGNPVETMAYSLDCFLKDMFKNIEIQYARTIWQLIMPILYVLAFFLLYGASIALNQIEYSFCVISTTLIYMFIYLQPNIVAGQIGLLSYRVISEIKWILGNVAIQYQTNYHKKWMLSYSLPVLLVVGILIPIVFFFSLYRIQNQLNLIKNRLAWGYLYNEYKQIAFYWEIVKIIQKVLIIIFLTFYSDQIIVKAALVYAIIFIYNYFTILIYPYQSIKLNVLDHESTRICGVSIVLAIGIYGSITNQILEVQIPFYIVLALVNFLFLAKLIFEIIQAYFYKFEVILDRVRDLMRSFFPNLLKYPYFRRILKNQGQARKRAIRNFQQAKIILIMRSKERLKLLDQKKGGTFIIETQTSQISSTKQLHTTQNRLQQAKDKHANIALLD